MHVVQSQTMRQTAFAPSVKNYFITELDFVRIFGVRKIVFSEFVQCFPC